MRTRELSLVASLVAAAFATGCATTERAATAPSALEKRDADAIFFVSGLA